MSDNRMAVLVLYGEDKDLMSAVGDLPSGTLGVKITILNPGYPEKDDLISAAQSAAADIWRRDERRRNRPNLRTLQAGAQVGFLSGQSRNAP